MQIPHSFRKEGLRWNLILTDRWKVRQRLVQSESAAETQTSAETEGMAELQGTAKAQGTAETQSANDTKAVPENVQPDGRKAQPPLWKDLLGLIIKAAVVAGFIYVVFTFVFRAYGGTG